MMDYLGAMGSAGHWGPTPTLGAYFLAYFASTICKDPNSYSAMLSPLSLYIVYYLLSGSSVVL